MGYVYLLLLLLIKFNVRIQPPGYDRPIISRHAPRGTPPIVSNSFFDILSLFLAPNRLYAQGFWAIMGAANPMALLVPYLGVGVTSRRLATLPFYPSPSPP